MATAREDVAGCCSALSAAALAASLTRTPVWYGVISIDRIETVRTHGLRSEDEPRRRMVDPRTAPRPGCFFLGDRSCEPWMYDLADLTEDTGVTVAVDLAGSDPRRIFPDEDEWTSLADYTFDPHAIGLLRDRETGHQSTGAWAEAVNLGAQPGVSEMALRNGRIAVRAPITADRVAVVRRESGETLAEWEARFLAERRCGSARTRRASAHLRRLPFGELPAAGRGITASKVIMTREIAEAEFTCATELDDIEIWVEDLRDRDLLLAVGAVCLDSAHTVTGDPALGIHDGEYGFLVRVADGWSTVITPGTSVVIAAREDCV